MSKSVIEVKSLSKSYVISHQKEMKKASIVKSTLDALKKPLGGGGPGYNQETFWALKDVSFSVQQGEIFGVLGKNGSGKSTLLKILSRIVEPTKGGVTLRGRTASLLEVGTGFHPELTGRENVFLNGSMLGLSRQEIIGKFNEIVEFSEIEQFIDTPVKFYSSGMYVRLAFAVAAHLEPEILILDEVLAVGDASFQKKSMDKILKIMQEGRTVLFVSHSTASVRQLCSKAILLKDGHVQAEGNAGEIIDQYMVETMNNGSLLSNDKNTWTNLGKEDNDTFKPLGAFLVDERNHELNKDADLHNNRDYWICIRGDLKIEDDTFNVGYAVWDNESKNLVYLTTTTDGKPENWPILKKGPVTVLGRLPANLLNGGRYKIIIIVSLYGKGWVYDMDSSPIRFEIEVKHSHFDSPRWADARGGLIAPTIDWKVQ